MKGIQTETENERAKSLFDLMDKHTHTGDESHAMRHSICNVLIRVLREKKKRKQNKHDIKHINLMHITHTNTFI